MSLYWISELRSNSTGRGITRDQQEMALEQCASCPVQHRCVAFAIESKDHFGLWAVDDTHRRALSRRKDWRDLLALAEASEMSVRELTRQIMVEDAERKAALLEA